MTQNIKIINKLFPSSLVYWLRIPSTLVIPVCSVMSMCHYSWDSFSSTNPFSRSHLYGSSTWSVGRPWCVQHWSYGYHLCLTCIPVGYHWPAVTLMPYVWHLPYVLILNANIWLSAPSISNKSSVSPVHRWILIALEHWSHVSSTSVFSMYSFRMTIFSFHCRYQYVSDLYGRTNGRTYSIRPVNNIHARQQHNYIVCKISIISFDIIKWYMSRETPIKANNVAALIGATLELNKHN